MRKITTKILNILMCILIVLPNYILPFTINNVYAEENESTNYSKTRVIEFGKTTDVTIGVGETIRVIGVNPMFTTTSTLVAVALNTDEGYASITGVSVGTLSILSLNIKVVEETIYKNITPDINFDTLDYDTTLNIGLNETKVVDLGSQSFETVQEDNNVKAEYVKFLDGSYYYLITGKDIGASVINIMGKRVTVFVELEKYVDKILNDTPDTLTSKECNNLSSKYQGLLNVYCIYQSDNKYYLNVETVPSASPKTITKQKEITYEPIYTQYDGYSIQGTFQRGNTDYTFSIFDNGKEVSNYSDFKIISEDTSIVEFNNDKYTYSAYKKGKVNVTILNKKTLESNTIIINVTVPASSSESPSNIIDNFNSEMNTYDSSTVEVPVDMQSYDYLNDLIKDTADKYGVNVNNIRIDYNSTSSLYCISYQINSISYEIKKINTIKVGVVKSSSTANKDSSYKYNSFFYEYYLNGTKTYSFEYDSNKVSIDETNKKIKFLSVGTTTIKITVVNDGKTYTATNTINVYPSTTDYNNFKNILINGETINLPISVFESNSNEDVVKMMIKDYYINQIKDTDLYDYTDIYVSLLLNNYAYITVNVKGNSPIVAKKIKYAFSGNNTTYLSNVNVIENNIKELENLNFEDSNNITSLCGTNTSCITNLLKTKIASSTDYDVELELINASGYNEAINYYNYKVKVYKDNFFMIEKNINVLLNLSVKYDNNTTLTEEEFIANHYLNNLSKTVSVTSMGSDVYKIEDGTVTYYNYLNKTKDTKATGIQIKSSGILSLNVGEEKELEFQLYPKYSTISPEYKIKSSDESVLKVDGNKLIGIKKGYAYVTLESKSSSTTTLVLVGCTTEEYLNDIINLIDGQDFKIDKCSELTNSLEIALTTSILDYLTSMKKYSYYLSFTIKEVDGEIRVSAKIYSNSKYYESKDVKITYSYVGIIADESEYELTSGDEVNTHLSFTEGDISNLVIESSNKDYATMDNKGIIKAIKTGCTTFYIFDIYNKYTFTIKVFVNKEEMQKNIKDTLTNTTYIIDMGDVSSDTEKDSMNNFIGWKIEDEIRRLGTNPEDVLGTYPSWEYHDTYMRMYTYSTSESIKVKYKLVGIDVPYRISLGLNEEVIPEINTYNTNTVTYTSLDPSIAKVENGKIIGVKSGVTRIKYTDGNYVAYQFVIVDLNGIIKNVKSKMSSVSNTLSIPTSKYSEDTLMEYGSSDSYLYTEQYYVSIENSINEKYSKDLLGDYLVYPEYQIENIYEENDKDYLDINFSLSYRYYSEKYDTYLEEQLLSTEDSNDLNKKFELQYSTEATKEEEALGIEIQNSLKTTYTLNFAQTIRYILNDRQDMYKYSSILDDIHKICPECSIIYSARLGDGDVGYEMNGGIVYIIKNNHIIGGLPEVRFESRSQIKAEKAIRNTTELYKLIKKEVTSSYEEVMKENNKDKSNFLSLLGVKNVYAEDNVNVEINREYDENVNNYIYGIKVNDIEMHTLIDTVVDGEEYNVPLTNISVNNKNITITEKESVPINITYTPSNATTKDLTFEDYDTNIINVSSTGIVTGKKAGSTTITVKSVDGSLTDTVNVTVKPSEIKTTSINFDSSSYVIAISESRQTNISISPYNHTDNITLSYVSSNPSVVSINQNGVITGVSAGNATIYATSSNGIVTSSNVSVYDPIPANSARRFVVKGLKNKTYTGKTLKQTLKVYMNGKKLTLNKDYKISYANNKNAGLAYVYIKGYKKYCETLTLTFLILPKKTVIKTPVSYKGGKIKTSWTKQSGASGYEIAYKVYKGKYQYIYVPNISSYTLTGLLKNKKYQIKVRAFIDVNSNRYYGAWSTLKTKTTK